jgi:type IV secretory pathway TrbF-like protein
MSKTLGNNKGFVTLLGTILTLAIICYLVYILVNTLLKPTIPDNETNSTLQSNNIDTTNYKSIADSVRNRVKDLNKKSLEQANQIEELTK